VRRLVCGGDGTDRWSVTDVCVDRLCYGTIHSMARLRRTSTPEPGVTVVGLGNWGSSLVQALQHSAFVDGVHDGSRRDRTGRRISPVLLRERVHARPATHNRGEAPREARRGGSRGVVSGAIPLEAAALDARILWLSVPDGAIESTVVRILRRRSSLEGQVVLHSSGALTRDALALARAAGALVASVHPLMSFPSRRPVPLAGVPFGVEAQERSLRRMLFQLVRQLGGKPFTVPSEGKALYHAAGMFASPLLTSLMTGAATCLRAAGIDHQQAERLLGPLAAATVANMMREGLRQSLSGPWARGDVSTVKLHLQALQPHPLLAETYRNLAVLALDSLPTHDTEALSELLTAETPAAPHVVLRPGSRARREGD
jgi:predicted short-subunit dehydrogenase-like oxidoreductase (DUF2520 family)